MPMGPEVYLSLPLRYPQKCVYGPKEPGFYPMQGTVPCFKAEERGSGRPFNCYQLFPNTLSYFFPCHFELSLGNLQETDFTSHS